jgi:UDP-N-acetylmuramoyl-L-alanyl-D-glutamate--2,6-diaminopimelate ligase
MITLHDILYKCPLLEVRGDLGTQVADFFFDSRAVVAGSLFVAVRGTTSDGHAYIDASVGKGALAVVCEEFPAELAGHVVWIKVADAALSLAHIAANYYGNPADSLKIIGVTGTNGKTTTATLLHKLFSAMGERSGLLSTVVVLIGEEEMPATHTTPDAKQLHLAFRKMVDAGCNYCFMEVSSHALVQRRVAGIKFAGAVFTNLTHDHLDYHGDFKNYIAAKKILFDELGSSAFGLVNADDKNGAVMLQNCKGRHLTYSLKRMADYKGRIIENTFEGLYLGLNDREAWFRLIGSFNAYNLLAVYAVAKEMELDEDGFLEELSNIDGVNGRFQTITSAQRARTAIVDYAHTPDALKNVLETIRDIRQGSGKIITVVGCGGNRDQAKRPVMAEIATRLSDQVVLTSDNPRDEDPSKILEQMLAGVPVSGRRKVMSIENRKEAIAVACRLAQPNDIILVAGKGHETYQEIKGVKHPFDDRQVLAETFKTLES